MVAYRGQLEEAGEIGTALRDLGALPSTDGPVHLRTGERRKIGDQHRGVVGRARAAAERERERACDTDRAGATPCPPAKNLVHRTPLVTYNKEGPGFLLFG